MNTYKITNITNLVGKRDPKFNSVVNLEYVDNRTKKTIGLKAGDSVYLTVQSLPLSIHRLRIKKLIDIIEVSPAELKKSIEKSKPKKKPVVKKETTKKPVVKKETTKKSTENIEEIVDEITEPVVEKKTTSRKKTVEKD